MDPFLPSRSEDSLYFFTVDNTIEVCIAHEWLWETVKKKQTSKKWLYPHRMGEGIAMYSLYKYIRIFVYIFHSLAYSFHSLIKLLK